MEGSLAQGIYVGNFTHRLDARKRVTVPSSWRVTGDEGNFYFGWENPAGCIAVMPPRMLQDLMRKAETVAQYDLKKRAMLRQFFGKGYQFGVDKQGRILLAENLLRHATISREAVLVGLGATFEIWNPEKYAAEDAGVDITDAMEELQFF